MIIPPESIVVFWNTVMALLGIILVISPVAALTIWIVDRKIVKPEYEKIKKENHER